MPTLLNLALSWKSGKIRKGVDILSGIGVGKGREFSISHIPKNFSERRKVFQEWRNKNISRMEKQKG